MKKHDKKINVSIIVTLAISLFIFVVLVLPKQSDNDDAFLEKHGLRNKTVKEMVSYLDAVVDEDAGFYAGIDSNTLTIGDNDNQFSYTVPSDQFYLSVAPYINSTHPCGIHNLVTCRGELQNQTMSIIIKNENGETIIDDEFTTMQNGFLGLWLPKNMDGSITVTYQGKTATSDIQTYEGDNTCLTTLKLT